MKEPKQVTLKELREAERVGMQDVWVMNRTGSGGKQAGNLVITVVVNGIQEPLFVPATWIPINLSEFINSEDVLKEPKFRREISIGRLTLHDAEECEKFMQQPDARAEYERIHEMRTEIDGVVNQNIEVYSDNLTRDSQPSMEIASNRIQSEEQAQAAQANGSVGVLTLVVQTLMDDDTDPAQKMNALRTNQSQLNEVDLKYIIKTCSIQSIQNWARALLADKRADKKKTDKADA